MCFSIYQGSLSWVGDEQKAPGVHGWPGGLAEDEEMSVDVGPLHLKCPKLAALFYSQCGLKIRSLLTVLGDTTF